MPNVRYFTYIFDEANWNINTPHQCTTSPPKDANLVLVGGVHVCVAK